MTPEKLQTFWLSVTIIAIILTALGTYYTFFYGQQIQKNKQSEFNELEKSFNGVKEDFSNDQELLKSILIDLKVTMSGEWKVSPGNGKLVNPLNIPIMYLMNPNDDSIKISLYEINNFRFNDINNQTSEFVVQLSPRKQDIIEMSKPFLKNFTAIQIMIPFIKWNDYGPLPVNIDVIDIKIYINEKLGYEQKETVNYKTTLDNQGSEFAGWVIFSINFDSSFINLN